MPRLFVNVDHVATVREASKIHYPSPLRAAAMAEDAGASGITVHLREDRRHIQDQDVYDMRRACRTEFNLECAVSEEIINIALDICPDQVTLVPEKREEVTTEGGLDLKKGFDRLQEVTRRLQQRGILVSLFIDPDPQSITLARDLQATHIELHTGRYANAGDARAVEKELSDLARASEQAQEMGLTVNAGHGLHMENTLPVARLPGIHDLNIGHALIADAIFVGLPAAVAEMNALIQSARPEGNSKESS